MPRINLLPWREEQRKQRQKQFGIALVVAVLTAGLFIWLGNLVYQGRIDHQQARNQRLETEIAELDKAIAEIEGLERQKERLLARMEIIEQLQRSRPEIVHLFDELVRTLPEGVYLTGIRQTGREVQITGTAQSSTRVSALMRNIDASEWLEDPDLEQIRTVEVGQAEQFNFVLRAKQVRIAGDDDDEEEAA
ncbi:MAG: PilN domain-containing protein [Gammaproteobacteria bacterium]|jgi:type IV pilus assembly protein PilN